MGHFYIFFKYFSLIDLNSVTIPREDMGGFYNPHFTEEELRVEELKRLAPKPFSDVVNTSVMEPKSLGHSTEKF